MSQQGIRILTPVVVTTIEEAQFVALRVELEKIAATDTRWPMAAGVRPKGVTMLAADYHFAEVTT